MPKIRKRLGYSRLVPFLAPSLALSITPPFLSINDVQDFQDDSGLLLDALLVFFVPARGATFTVHSSRLSNARNLKIKTTLRRTLT